MFAKKRYDLSIPLMMSSGKSRIKNPEYAMLDYIKTHKVGNLDIKFDYRIVLENAWMGYSSIKELSYQLPAYGILNSTLINFIEQFNFDFYATNYNQGHDWAFEKYLTLKKLLIESNTNLDNPVASQENTQNTKDAIEYFIGKCGQCRAYIGAEKKNWKYNERMQSTDIKNRIFIDHNYWINQERHEFQHEIYFVYGDDNLKTTFKEA